MTYKVEIPLKLPSLNDFLRKSNYSRFAGNKLKQDTEKELCEYLSKLPKFTKPVTIKFTWIEKNQKRDLDNICSAKKFILDALVKCGVLEDDNRNYVQGFTDTFPLGKETMVVLEISEVEE